MQLLLAIVGLMSVVSFAFAEDSNERSRFRDVYPSDKHRAAIEWMADQGIVKGYPDESFRGDRTVNRAEAVKMIVASTSDTTITQCRQTVFTDVAATDWYEPFVCVALNNNWIESNESQLFRPSDTINAGELSVLLARVYDLPSAKSNPWYASAMQSLGSRKVIPPDIEAAGQSVSRAQLAEFLWRLETDPDPVLHADADAVIAVKCDWQDSHDIPSVDDQEVVRAWMTWVNNLRIESGLVPYTVDRQLTRTAQEWSDYANDVGYITHKRNGQTSYYDYARMADWFSDREIEFKNIQSSTFTENIGWGVYNCSKADCTQELIDALRTTFNFYLAEKDKASRPHYNSMMNDQFRLAGIGITVNYQTGRYYFTAHYGTAITSKPDPVCP